MSDIIDPSNVLLEHVNSMTTFVLEPNIVKAVDDACKLIQVAFSTTRKKLFVCGNGGSAADSQHMVAELVGRFGDERPGLPAISLATDTSILTAVANDWEYSYVFRRQLEALGGIGDVLIGITTSGNSANVLEALGYAKSIGMKTVGLVGKDGGKLAQLDCDVVINVGGTSTPLIQERMLVVEHTICEVVEKRLRGIIF